MKQVTADEVREFANQRYVAAARKGGQTRITIRAGDVPSAMQLSNRMPLVCSALRAKAFEVACRVNFVSEAGPHQGANKTMTFEVLP
jgi:hypothetical protein